METLMDARFTFSEKQPHSAENSWKIRTQFTKMFICKQPSNAQHLCELPWDCWKIIWGNYLIRLDERECQERWLLWEIWNKNHTFWFTLKIHCLFILDIFSIVLQFKKNSEIKVTSMYECTLCTCISAKVEWLSARVHCHHEFKLSYAQSMANSIVSTSSNPVWWTWPSYLQPA